MKTLLLLLSAASAISAEPRTYRFEPAPDLRMELRVEKTGLLRGKQHLFQFERFSGKLQYDSKAPESSKVSFTVEAGSAVCKDTWLSAKDLRKVQAYALNDMLDVARHPAISFASASVRKVAEGYEVRGTLTIRNVAKPAVLTVTHSLREDGSMSINGNARIRLTDYGLKPPSAALGAIGTKDEMLLSFQLIGRAIRSATE